MLVVVLILLPPSETKTAHGLGPPLGFGDLVAPGLTGVRIRVANAVVKLAAGNAATAAAALRLPPGVVDTALAANRTLLESPTSPALDRYAGVLYAALAVPTMPAAVRCVADSSIVIWSGLFGLLQGRDHIPDYRVPVAAELPRIGSLTPVWRTSVRPAIPALLGRDFAVDLRSTDYAGMWAPTGPLRTQVLPVRVLTARPGGPRVISHRSKHGKGLLARALLERVAAGGKITDVSDVVSVIGALGWTHVVRRVVGGSAALDVVAPEPDPSA